MLVYTYTILIQKRGEFMKVCSSYKTCPFVKKYQYTDPYFDELISNYCKGNMQNQCKRKEYYTKKGISPKDNYLPNGKFA